MSIARTVTKMVDLVLQNQQKGRVLVMFQDMSDRELADIGVSRELLNQGIRAYPWRTDEAAAGSAVSGSTKATSRFPQGFVLSPKGWAA